MSNVTNKIFFLILFVLFFFFFFLLPAAGCLAKKDATPAEVKTKARRLYDIANICCTLELVEKFRLPGTSYRKPVYRWIGFERYPWPKKNKKLKVQVPCPVELFEAAGILHEVPKDLYSEYYGRLEKAKTNRRNSTALLLGTSSSSSSSSKKKKSSKKKNR